MADKKITDLSQATDADSTDILMIVDGPGESSPQNKKITIQNLFSYIFQGSREIWNILTIIRKMKS